MTMVAPDIRIWPGYHGVFTREEAEGAIPNDAIVRKINAELDDRTPLDTIGTILGSVDAERLDPVLAKRHNIKFIYFIEWHNQPRTAVVVADWKIARDQ